MMYELPPQGRGTAEQQLEELRNYLVRMARELDTVGASEVVIEKAANKAVEKKQQKTVEDIKERADALKSLIIKTADEVKSYADSKVEEYASTYVAKSDFGTFLSNAELQVQTMATGVVESYHYSEAIAAAQDAANNAQITAEAYITDLNGQIRRGIVEDPDTHELHYGIAISENLVFTGEQESREGNIYYKVASGQTLGLYTSTGWQFWIGGNLCGYFSSVESGKLHVMNIVVDNTLQLGDWEITTTGGFGLRYIGA